MPPKAKKSAPAPETGDNAFDPDELDLEYEGPVSIDLGEIELELDDDDQLVVERDDEYVDRYQTADFFGSAVSLMADYNSTVVAERRGELVDSARRQAESEASPCWPGCMASQLDMVPVFRYDKVLVADDRASVSELERQLQGVDGFAPRSLALEISALRDATRFGGKDRAWRPVLPPSGEPDDSVITVRSAIDPAERHCALPDEACGSLRIDSGKFSRPRGADPLSDRVRLLPGDRVQLVRVDRDGDEFSFEDFVPDAKALAAERGVMTPGHADRIVSSMGLSWSLEFVALLRASADEAADAFVFDADAPVVVKGTKRRGEERFPAAVRPSKANVERLQAAVDKKLASLKRPAKSKGGGKGGDDVVRVYRDPGELAADENNEDAVQGPEHDDTPRSILADALALPADGRPLEERIREAADTRLSKDTVANIARGGKRIEVGQRVSLRSSGVEQVFMRAREQKTGSLFWALQTTRAAGSDSKKGEKCDKADPDRGCYVAAPSEAEIAEFQIDVLQAASDRLSRAAKKFDPDEASVAAARCAMTDGGYYRTAEYESVNADVKYVSDRRNTYETAFRPMALPPPPDAPIKTSSGDKTTYRQLAASALLAVVFPGGVRLPKQVDGTSWLIRVTVPPDDAYAELDTGGGTDPLRLKFLVETAMMAASVAVLLSDAEAADAEARLARADVTPFIESAKAADAWAAAVKKKLSAEDIAKEAEALRLRSPLLDHIAEIMETSEDRVEEADAELLEPSRLKDWSGYRPSPEDMGAPEPSVLIEPASRGPGNASSASRTPATIDAGTSGEMSAVLKRLGMSERHKDRETVEAFLRAPTRDGAAAVRSAVMSTFALMGKIASGMTGDQTVSRFKRTSKADARDALRRTRAMRGDSSLSPEDAVRAWLKLAEESGPDVSVWMVESLATRLRTAETDVDALLERMAAAKEAIKNEKIEFFETAIDEDMQGTLAELRKLGLQTVDEQIIAYDAKQQASDREAGMGYPEGNDEFVEDEGYDTMQMYDDDGGVDFD